MALQIIGETKREFNMKKGNDSIKIEDPNPNFSPEEVMKFMANKHPELTTATLSGPVVNKEGVAVYEFSTKVGTKG